MTCDKGGGWDEQAASRGVRTLWTAARAGDGGRMSGTRTGRRERSGRVRGQTELRGQNSAINGLQQVNGQEGKHIKHEKSGRKKDKARQDARRKGAGGTNKTHPAASGRCGPRSRAGNGGRMSGTHTGRREPSGRVRGQTELRGHNISIESK